MLHGAEKVPRAGQGVRSWEGPAPLGPRRPPGGYRHLIGLHLGGSAAPGPVGQTAALIFLLTLSASSAATPELPHSSPPATVATCSHLLRHSDSAPLVLPFYPPQLALHSPFYDSRWEAGEVRRGNGASFTAASSPGHAAMAAPSSGHHAAVRKVVSASFEQGN